MTAIATTGKGRALIRESIGYLTFAMAAVKIMKGAAVAIDLATGYVTNESTSGSLFPIGVAAETIDNSGGSAGALKINVKMAREIEAIRFINSAASGACAATDIGKQCYFVDNQTVSILPTAGPLAGTIWGVSATDGVLVELAMVPKVGSCDLPGPAIAYVANDCALTRPGRGLHYLITTTAAATTISLGSTGAIRGDRVSFTADGVANGHTVTYRDGTTAKTTALTASKAHGVEMEFDGTAWQCKSAYVSP